MMFFGMVPERVPPNDFISVGRHPFWDKASQNFARDLTGYKCAFIIHGHDHTSTTRNKEPSSEQYDVRGPHRPPINPEKHIFGTSSWY